MWRKLKRFYLAIILLTVSPILSARAIIDADVLHTLRHSRASDNTPLSILVFLHNISEKESFIEEIKKFRM